ncbi:hypothetical protein PV08_07293 [Exophiala spinifera]|uniref:GST N-terminal domain-containing protein n=1 Tax=Exophiala spinifera TaxID=91928 RepID=A0A0D2BTG7_9EURO|nr:uncharacterized protein PV08_07293 [Exophiala spinifera]KIW14509.1 hypothetical protein PV08_07293 [Exophiala spinifera]
MHSKNAPVGVYTLYYNRFSICSLMTLLTIRWKGQPASLEQAIDIVEEEVDIYAGEQNEEEFLKKNWKGQVPVLLGPCDLKVTDSLQITKFLASRYTGLIPSGCEDVITAMLNELHQVWFVSLSFSAQEGRGAGILLQIQNILAQPTTSDDYKTALQRKLQYYATTYQADPHAPEIVAREKLKTQKFLEKIARTRHFHNIERKSKWIFGVEIGPTALDAHTVVFIARLIDAGHASLIGSDMLEYGTQHLESNAWRGIVDGNTTLHSLWERQEAAKTMTVGGGAEA